MKSRFIVATSPDLAEERINGIYSYPPQYGMLSEHAIASIIEGFFNFANIEILLGHEICFYYDIISRFRLLTDHCMNKLVAPLR